MIRIEYNDSDVRAGLDALGLLMADMTPVFQDIGDALVESTNARFVAGEDPEGNAWLPKSQATLDRYARGNDPVSTRPLHGPSLQLSRTIHYQAGSDQVEIGSPMIYAGMMQFGGAKAQFPHLWGDIPARPFLGVSDGDRVMILEILSEYMTEATGGTVE